MIIMPALLERPKMTKLMYQALKKHIMQERERKKQAEQEQDAMLEQQKKEKEMKKKKKEDSHLTLEQTKEQITQLEKKLELLRQEKHACFSQLKKVLHQEDETRKKAQQKDELSQPPTIYQHTGMPPVSAHSVLHPLGRPQMYRPAQSIIAQPVASVPLKRPRSPSPTPNSGYQQYENKKAATPAHYVHSNAQEFKPVNYPSQPSQVTYVSQPVHSFQSTVAYTTSKSPGSKYQVASQSAFAAYSSSPYGQHQHQSPYTIGRMPQQGFLPASSISLQQQLQQANEKSGFNEGDKYKQMQQTQIRAVAPGIQGQQGAMIPISLQQEMPGRGSIVTGFSGRSQAPPTSTFQPSSTQVSYSGQQPGPRPSYQSSQGRYF
ncbi:G protein pathway suppressor 2-like [Dreissena polymorpha]|nr:G protein pathway suppressor 2-like [Dreissena polymorpha]